MNEYPAPPGPFDVRLVLSVLALAILAMVGLAWTLDEARKARRLEKAMELRAIVGDREAGARARQLGYDELVVDETDIAWLAAYSQRVN